MPSDQLSREAADDLRAIARYTIKTWGIEQAKTCESELKARLEKIGKAKPSRATWAEPICFNPAATTTTSFTTSNQTAAPHHRHPPRTHEPHRPPQRPPLKSERQKG